jgi:hypothetical protein
MMAMMQRTRRLALLAVGLALTLSIGGCISVLASHGVDYIPAFDTPDPTSDG